MSKSKEAMKTKRTTYRGLRAGGIVAPSLRPKRFAWRGLALWVSSLFAVAPISAQTWDAILTSSTTISETDFTYDGLSVLVQGAVTVTMNGVHSFVNLGLTNGAVLTHAAATASSAPRLELTVSDTLSVSTNSRIDVKDKGYLTGRTYPNTTTGASTGRSGGSYGDWEVNYSTGNVNPVYGDYMNPNEPGSGSGADNGGPGGGLARITAGVLDLRGQLTASASDSCYGRGSGGGIYLNVGRLTGEEKFWRWVEGALVRMPAAVGGG